MKKLVIISTLLILGCQDRQVEIGRTADGTLKYKAELRDGVRNGQLIEYYPNGNVESIANWNDGQVEGQVRNFYEDGSVKSISYWKSGHNIGSYRYFYLDENLLEAREYDDKGNLIYVSKFSEKGDTLANSAIPILTSVKDTLNIGEDFRLKIGFGYPFYGDFMVHIGRSTKVDSVTTNFEIDTTLANDGNNNFNYEFKPSRSGYHSVTAWIEYTPSKQDSVTFNGASKDYSFYVLPNEMLNN